MQDNIAKVIVPVVDFTLAQLALQAPLPDLAGVQTQLTSLIILARAEDRRLLESLKLDDVKTGVVSALVYWVDEVFKASPTWAIICSAIHLESRFREIIVAENERASCFCRNAEAAVTMDSELLEVYWLLVELGFRGEFADNPERFDVWLAAAARRLKPGWRLQPCQTFLVDKTSHTEKTIWIPVQPPVQQKESSLPKQTIALPTYVKGRGLTWVVIIVALLWMIGAGSFLGYYLSTLQRG